MQHFERISVILKIWNVVLRVRVTFNSVGGGVIDPPLACQQNAEYGKYHVFRTSETSFCAGID